MQKSSIKIALSVSLVLTTVLPSSKVEAHRSGCHRWHSCPSDTTSYVCGDLGYSSQCPPATKLKNLGSSPRSLHSRYMKAGNKAVQKKDYQTALINFRRALAISPEDSNAKNAIFSVEHKIKQKK